MTVTEDIATWAPEARKREIPYHVVLWLIGANLHKKYCGGDGAALEMDKTFYPMSGPDFEVVEAIAMKLAGELPHRVVTPWDWMHAHKLACKYLDELDSGTDTPDAKVVMLKDKGGAGYWRMTLPGIHLDRTLNGTENRTQIDVTGASMKFEELLEYDTIYVQRLHSWESYYVLKNLKKAGRRIVYDMDDDIFSLTPDNPAFHVISRDNQQAAVACMNLADVVTTTTQVLANRLVQVLEQDVEMVVIPNALDTDDGWFPTERTGSLDGNKRIFWQGSATHGKDWEVCIEAIDRLMQEHFNVHLIILGFLPPVVIERLGLQHWSKRVQHLGFNDSETYFKLIHHIKADVGIAPLAPQGFNEAKSPIKWLEYTCIGMPTVASDMEPYSSVIEDGVTGYLVPPDTDAWYGRLKECLEKPVEHKQLIVDARKEAKEYFDIKTVASVWNAVLLPSSSETPATT